MERCPWCLLDPIYIKYHDEEWGVPIHDDRKHFELLILESFQAGLSWLTILKKRENFRRAYSDFDPEKVSKYDDKDVQRLLKNDGIIRNKRKIEASIHNARKFIEIQREFGSFDEYIWRFVNYKPIINSWEKVEDLPSRTDLSDVISEDLRKRGFVFMGSIIVYSYMQAAGLVNDHLVSCFRYKELLQK
ncbi:MAG: DNA-3-methyladenine glycosylase I [Caldanaerobacter sp.]|uniref:DNA-3-methyladenine glycosylase I n=1 Tax=Caldanaerobacter sp. TaxID=2930036 RepID=UPI003C719E3D